MRLIEVILPADAGDELDRVLADSVIVERWNCELSDQKILTRLLVDPEQAEKILDSLMNRFDKTEGFRVMLLIVEATLPRPESREPESSIEEADEEQNNGRISRDEIYDDVAAGAKISQVYMIQVVLATLVASIGLMRDDLAVLIGAMVIAPLLGPNVALCLATTLGDWKLASASLRANAVGLLIALVVAVIIGWLLPVDLQSPAILNRTQVGPGDIVLALAAGCAGVLSFTTGVPSALIGVMVAVALLPPYVTFGLLLAQGELRGAFGALMLAIANVICVNLSGVLTFALQGVRPRTWLEEKRASGATRWAIAIWTTLLVILCFVIWFASEIL